VTCSAQAGAIATSSLLVDFDAAPELLVLVADVFDQFLIGGQTLIDTHREGMRVRLRIGDA